MFHLNLTVFNVKNYFSAKYKIWNGEDWGGKYPNKSKRWNAKGSSSIIRELMDHQRSYEQHSECLEHFNNIKYLTFWRLTNFSFRKIENNWFDHTWYQNVNVCVSDERLPSITQFPNSVTVQNYINLSKLKEREKSRKINLMVLPARQLGRVTLQSSQSYNFVHLLLSTDPTLSPGVVRGKGCYSFPNW